MITLNSCTTMDELDLTVSEDILLMRSSSCTATFTLSSLSSTSSSYTNLYNHHLQHQNGRSATMCSSTSPTNSFLSEHHRSFSHSQSIMIENRKRRPTIHDPYQLAPNLQVLDDWIIVSSSSSSSSSCFLFSDHHDRIFQLKFQSILLIKINNLRRRKKANHQTMYFNRNEINDRGDKWELIKAYYCYRLTILL